MSNVEIEEIVNKTISKYHEECSKIPKNLEFIEKLQKHEELIIKVILETLLQNQ